MSRQFLGVPPLSSRGAAVGSLYFSLNLNAGLGITKVVRICRSYELCISVFPEQAEAYPVFPREISEKSIAYVSETFLTNYQTT
jgi:hypothetical protein